jgi:RHS repeat-associated protein
MKIIFYTIVAFAALYCGRLVADPNSYNYCIVNFGRSDSSDNVNIWYSSGGASCGSYNQLFSGDHAYVGITFHPNIAIPFLPSYPTTVYFGYTGTACVWLAQSGEIMCHGGSSQFTYDSPPNGQKTAFIFVDFERGTNGFRYSFTNDKNDRGPRRPNPCGMPVFGVSEPSISLWMQDEPLGYQPALGPRVSVGLGYNQREGAGLYPSNFFGAFSTNFFAGYNTNFFSTGLKWNCSWFSFVTQDPNSNNVVHFSDGGLATLFGTNDYLTYGHLSGDTTNGFTLTYPNGSQDVFKFMVTNNLGIFQEAFLTKRIDPQMHALTFNYFSYNPSNPVVRLQNVIDGDGRTNRINYVASNARSTNLISQIIDPFFRTNFFAYDSNGRLTNLTDVQGLSTAFAYDGNDWVTSMVTPYGTNTFQLTDTAVGDIPPNGRSVLITRPDGSQELYLYTNGAPGIASSYASSQVPNTTNSNYSFSNTIGNTNLDQDNTFYWGPRQCQALSTNVITSFKTNDFRKSRMRHWLQETDGYGELFVGQTVSMERDPSPDNLGTIEGQKIWFDYAGKSNPDFEGTQSLPLLVARVLPDGTTSFVRTERNSIGNITNGISSYSSGGSVAVRTNSFSYDATAGIDLITATNALRVQVSSNAYNAYHQVTNQFDALNQITTFAYNTNNTNQQLISATLPSGLIITNIYGTDNWLATTFAFSTSGGTTYFATNTYTYAKDLVFSKTDGRGLTTTNTWDNLQRLTTVTYPDGTFVSNVYSRLDLVQVFDRMGFSNSFAYDSMRRKIYETNANGKVTSYDYCTCGALNAITNALGQYTQFFYDNQGRLTNTIYPDIYSVTANFDLLGRLTNTVDSAGVSVTNWFNNQGLQYATSNYFGQVALLTFDILDRITNSVDANNVTITNTFDNLNRLLTRGYPDGGVEQFAYSARGLILYTNQLTNVTAYGYDAALRKLVETNASQEITQYSYDPAGDLLTLTDGKLQTTSWNYDAFGRATNKVDATSTVIFKYSYDADNRLTNRFSLAKSNTVYSYDAVGNLLTITYPVSPSITLSYDALNRLTNMVDAVGTTRYGYTSAGQLLSEDGPWSDDTLSYVYNNRLLSNVSLQQPNADPWSQAYAFDGAKRLTNLTSQAGSFAYGYDASRNLQVAKLLFPNAAYITNTYDAVGRMLGTMLLNSGGSLLDTNGYSYNVAGQRSQQVFTGGNKMDYTYDAIGQLTNASGMKPTGILRLQEQFGYFYDSAHNLSNRVNNALVEIFNYNNLNEISNSRYSGTCTVAGTTSTNGATSVNVSLNGGASVGATLYHDATFAAPGFNLADGTNTFTATGQDGLGRLDTNTVVAYLPATNSFSYDGNGNLLTDGLRNLAYDDENQLTSVWVTNAWRSDFAYDGKMRRRIRKEFKWQNSAWVQTNEVHYIYNGNYVIQERDVNNLPVVSYTRADGRLLARTDHSILNLQPSSANAHVYYHADGNGNITALINVLQFIVTKYEYDAFGTILSQCGPLADANLYRFSSKEYHQTSGLVYFGRRFYDSNLERWSNRDPLGERGSLNLFGFVDNDPIDRNDPLGLTTVVSSTPFPGQSPCQNGPYTLTINDGFHGVMSLQDYQSRLLLYQTDQGVRDETQDWLNLYFLASGIRALGNLAVDWWTGAFSRVAVPLPFCFPAGTQVLMADGSARAIETIQVGDEVLAQDPDVSSKTEKKRVVQLHHNWTQRLIDVEIARTGSGEIHGKVMATGEHLFWTQNRGWVDAKDLRHGDVLKGPDDIKLVVISAKSIPTVADTFNLSVDQSHTFFVLAGGIPVLVHNQGQLPIEQFETVPYGQFRLFPGDTLAGHEMLQNAWLRINGYGGPTFPQNPAMALPQEFHAGAVTPMQAEMGLHDAANLAGMSAEENILANAEILRQLRVPEAAINQAVDAAMQYAQTLPKPCP